MNNFQKIAYIRDLGYEIRKGKQEQIKEKEINSLKANLYKAYYSLFVQRTDINELIQQGDRL